jgi:hypothetical protein
LSGDLYGESVQRFGSNIALNALGSQDAGIIGLSGTGTAEGVGDAGAVPPDVVPGLDP